MTVTVYKEFPVKKYDMKGGELDGKTFYGSSSALNTIQINGNNIQLSAEDVELTLEDSKATYVLHVKDDTGLDASIKVVLTVEGNVLSMEIPEVVYNQENGKQEHPVQTIYFPDHSLVSVRSSQENATFAGSGCRITPARPAIPSRMWTPTWPPAAPTICTPLCRPTA